MITLRKNTFICGAITSDVAPVIAKLEAAEFPKKSDIIFLGNSGFWDSEEIPFQFFPLMDALEAADCRALFVRGNQDNPAIFSSGIRTKHFVLLKDLEEVRYGESIGLVYPGAISEDRYWKQLEELPGNKWFPNEGVLPSSSLKSLHYDFVLGHTGPCPPDFTADIFKVFSKNDKTLLSDLKRQQKEIKRMLKKTKPSVMVFGHYDISSEYVSCNARCISCSAQEIKELSIT